MPDMTAPAEKPTNWRDVYDLVRDAREDVLVEVRGLDAKMDTHLLEHAQARGASIARKSMLMATWSFAQRAIPLSALGAAILALLGVRA